MMMMSEVEYQHIALESKVTWGIEWMRSCVEVGRCLLLKPVLIVFQFSEKHVGIQSALCCTMILIKSSN